MPRVKEKEVCWRRWVVPAKQALKLLVLKSFEPSQGPQSKLKQREAWPCCLQTVVSPFLWLRLLFDHHRCGNHSVGAWPPNGSSCSSGLKSQRGHILNSGRFQEGQSLLGQALTSQQGIPFRGGALSQGSTPLRTSV